MKLDKHQKEAINCKDNKILVLAAAGSGKTTVLVERVAKLVSEGVNTQSMLILTFTNAAAFEMRERFKQRMPECAILPEFRTFHAFCYRLIVRDKGVRNALNYTSIPNIVYEGKLHNIKKEAILQCGIKLSVKQMDDPKSITTKAQLKQFELYQKAIDRLLRKENLITFDLLCYGVCKLFENDDPSIQKYKLQYKYLFVDEFQDTDSKQVGFLESFDPETTSWWLCGDALQNIYAWRGTSNATLKRLSKLDDWTKIRLDQNYRSTNQICQYVNARSKYADPSYRIEMKGQRDGDGVQEYFGARATSYAPVDKSHLKYVIKDLKQISEESAILCRSNNEVNFVCEQLREANISFTQSHKKSDFINVLKGSIDDEYMFDLLSSRLNSEVHADFIRLKAQTDNPDIQWFMNLYGRRPEIETLGKNIIDVRLILNAQQTNKEKLEKILKIDKLKFEIDEDDIQGLNAIELVEYLIELVQADQDSSIYVGTIHSVKGLQFPHVYVMGVNDYRFRLEDEEMKNLYYVALTRAQNHLTVFYGTY